MEEALTKIGDGTIISMFEQTKPGIVCPKFWECKPVNGCNYHCAWCYLNGTYRFKKDDRGVKIGKAATFKEPKKVEEHIQKAMEAINEPSLFNCGEVSDALIFPWMLEQHVLPIFKKSIHKVLLLTKDTNVAFLYNAKAQKCAIIAFSVNASFVSSTWETKAPHPWKRLEAARKVSEWGYPIRLRIDPMVPVQDWQKGYRELVDKIMEYVPNAEVITIGSLRMMTTNLRVCEELGNDTTYTSYLGEKTSRDYRVPSAIRIEMFDFVINELRTKGFKGHIALCKETDEVWKALTHERAPKRKNDPMIPARLPSPENCICNCKLGMMQPEKTKEEACKPKEE
jgi:spore photoproduct lyase